MSQLGRDYTSGTTWTMQQDLAAPESARLFVLFDGT
jgi:hypothetical protein